MLTILVIEVAALRPMPGHAQPALGAHGSAESDGFYRIHWYQRGGEHGNPKFNDRFRVNAPPASLHPTVGDRPEVRGNGLMQIRMDEDPRSIRGAALYLELWGGHRVRYTRSDVPTNLLRRGPNHVELHSDTRHHGIEVLLPGPVLVVRSRTGP